MFQCLMHNLGSKIGGFITKQVFQKYFFSGLRATSKNVISFLILSKDSIRICWSVDLSWLRAIKLQMPFFTSLWRRHLTRKLSHYFFPVESSSARVDVSLCFSLTLFSVQWFTEVLSHFNSLSLLLSIFFRSIYKYFFLSICHSLFCSCTLKKSDSLETLRIPFLARQTLPSFLPWDDSL